VVGEPVLTSLQQFFTRLIKTEPTADTSMTSKVEQIISPALASTRSAPPTSSKKKGKKGKGNASVPATPVTSQLPAFITEPTGAQIVETSRKATAAALEKEPSEASNPILLRPSPNASKMAKEEDNFKADTTRALREVYQDLQTVKREVEDLKGGLAVINALVTKGNTAVDERTTLIRSDMEIIKSIIEALQTRPIPVESGERVPMFMTEMKKRETGSSSEVDTQRASEEDESDGNSELMESAEEEIERVPPETFLMSPPVDIKKESSRSGLDKPVLHIGRAATSIPTQTALMKTSSYAKKREDVQVFF